MVARVLPQGWYLRPQLCSARHGQGRRNGLQRRSPHQRVLERVQVLRHGPPLLRRDDDHAPPQEAPQSHQRPVGLHRRQGRGPAGGGGDDERRSDGADELRDRHEKGGQGYAPRAGGPLAIRRLRGTPRLAREAPALQLCSALGSVGDSLGAPHGPGRGAVPRRKGGAPRGRRCPLQEPPFHRPSERSPQETPLIRLFHPGGGRDGEPRKIDGDDSALDRRHRSSAPLDGGQD
mmetsp:Transcript_17298/g.56616  ORF Transcript_17298/g.56616 Transcript_17298/m.56616 type:complete len:233 (-) Transcript_17298:248-946(-)